MGGLGHVEGVVGVVPCAVEVAVGPGEEGVQVVEVGGRQRRVADPGEVGGEGLDETVEFVALAGGEESRGEGDEDVAAQGRRDGQRSWAKRRSGMASSNRPSTTARAQWT